MTGWQLKVAAKAHDPADLLATVGLGCEDRRRLVETMGAQLDRRRHDIERCRQANRQVGAVAGLAVGLLLVFTIARAIWAPLPVLGVAALVGAGAVIVWAHNTYVGGLSRRLDVLTGPQSARITTATGAGAVLTIERYGAITVVLEERSDAPGRGAS